MYSYVKPLLTCIWLGLFGVVSTVAAAPDSIMTQLYGPGPYATIRNAKRVSLIIKPKASQYISGTHIDVESTFENHGNQTFLFYQLITPYGMFGTSMAWEATTGKPTPLTRRAKRGFAGETRATYALAAGKSVKFWTPVNVAHLDDLTVPGKYNIQLTAGVTKSNRVSVTVTAPLRVPEGKPALAAEHTPNLVWPKSNAIQLLAIAKSQDSHSNRRAVTAYVRNNTGRDATVELSGRPLIDFQDTQVQGPDGFQGDEKVMKPKPHWRPIPNHKPAPLTAYGKQLVVHNSPKDIQWKSYTLKPGEVYKYAAPVNLGCRFDMSMSGTYHVRLKLAQSKVQSAWTDVRIPQ